MRGSVQFWSDLPDSVLDGVFEFLPTADLLGSAAVVSRSWSAAAVRVCCQGQRRLQLRRRDGFGAWARRHACQLQSLDLEVPQPGEPHTLAACSLFQPDVPLLGLQSLTVETSAQHIPFGRQWPCMPQLTYLSIRRPELADPSDIMQLSTLCSLRHLGLQELFMTPPDCQIFSAALQTLPHLTSLDLSGGWLAGSSSLGYVPPVTSLQQLHLGVTYAAPDTLAALHGVPVMAITLLLMSAGPLEADSVGSWLNSSSASRLERLEVRVMEGSNLFHEPLPATITQGLAACSALQRLTCRGLDMGSLLPPLAGLPGLTCLRLLDCQRHQPPAQQAPAAGVQPEGQQQQQQQQEQHSPSHHQQQSRQQQNQPDTPPWSLPYVEDLVCSWMPQRDLAAILRPSVLPAVKRLRLRCAGTDGAVGQLAALLPGLQSLSVDGHQLTLAVLGGLSSLTALSALQLSVASSPLHPGGPALDVPAGAGSSIISSSSSSSSNHVGCAAISATLRLSRLRLLHVQTQLSQAAAAWLQAECAATGVQCVLKDTNHGTAAAAVEAAFVL